ncbi:hypothetical protein ACOMHN_040324 [Nucella lapillus]
MHLDVFHKIKTLQEEFEFDMYRHLEHVHTITSWTSRSRQDLYNFSLYKKLFLKCREQDAAQTYTSLQLLKQALMDCLEHTASALNLDEQSTCETLGRKMDEAWDEFELFKFIYFDNKKPEQLPPPSLVPVLHAGSSSFWRGSTLFFPTLYTRKGCTSCKTSFTTSSAKKGQTTWGTVLKLKQIRLLQTKNQTCLGQS